MADADVDKRKFMTLAEAARAHGVVTQCVKHWIQQGKLAIAKKTGSHVYLDRKAVEAHRREWLEKKLDIAKRKKAERSNDIRRIEKALSGDM